MRKYRHKKLCYQNYSKIIPKYSKIIPELKHSFLEDPLLKNLLDVAMR